MQRFRWLLLAMMCVLPAVATQSAFGRIKLITLPVRQRVEIQLDHANVTLVQEQRIVPLVAGINQVDFSWANARIDPNTIVFRVLGWQGDGGAEDPQVNVLSVSYPPNENALVWAVSSSHAGAARVRISYLLGQLTKSFNYRAVAAHDESTLVLSQYMRLQNMANEQFGSSNIFAGFGPNFQNPIGINETKEMLVEKFRRVPITKTYTCNPAEFDYLDRVQNKLRVPMHYVLQNAKSGGLGTASLPFGKVRIFQDDGRGTTAFVGEDWGQFTPVDDKMKLYLGVSQDIVVRRTIQTNNRRRLAGNLFAYEVVIQYEIENFKDKAVTLDIAEDLLYVRNEIRGDSGRDVEWVIGAQTTLGEPDAEQTNQQRAVFHVDLPAATRGEGGKAEKIIHKLHLLINNEW